jgi:hypothetical protein
MCTQDTFTVATTSFRSNVYLLGCFSLFLIRGRGLARSSIENRAALLALLGDLAWYVTNSSYIGAQYVLLSKSNYA